MMKIALAVATAALLLPVAAGATPPTSTIVSADATFTNTFDCAFPLTEAITGSYKDTVYYDAAGNPVGSEQAIAGSASAAQGVSLGDGSLALAWTANNGGDQDVMATRLTP